MPSDVDFRWSWGSCELNESTQIIHWDKRLVHFRYWGIGWARLEILGEHGMVLKMVTMMTMMGRKKQEERWEWELMNDEQRMVIIDDAADDDDDNNSKIQDDGMMVWFGLSPFPVIGTTRIITFLVGNPYKPSFPLLLARGTTQGMMVWSTHFLWGLWIRSTQRFQPWYLWGFGPSGIFGFMQLDVFLILCA